MLKVNKKKVSLSIVIGVLLLMFGIFYMYVIETYDVIIPCVFHRLTGWYCPGCGITRMILSLTEFQFHQAFHYNILVFSLLPYAILYFLTNYICWITDKPIVKLPRWFWNGLLVITILFGILRNISFFSVLAPM